MVLNSEYCEETFSVLSETLFLLAYRIIPSAQLGFDLCGDFQKNKSLAYISYRSYILRIDLFFFLKIKSTFCIEKKTFICTTGPEFTRIYKSAVNLLFCGQPSSEKTTEMRSSAASKYSGNCLHGHLYQPVTCLHGRLSSTPLSLHYLFDPCTTVSAQCGH